METLNGFPDDIPQSLRLAIQKLIDEKVEEKMKDYDQKFQEALSKLQNAATPSTAKKALIKNGSQSEARTEAPKMTNKKGED